jgi:hypothetical protein
MRFVTEGNEENEGGTGLSSAPAQDRRTYQMVRGFRRLAKGWRQKDESREAGI